MNEIETQILKNQSTILRALSDVPGLDNEALVSVDYRMNETKNLLNPKQSQSLPEKTEKALRKTKLKRKGAKE